MEGRCAICLSAVTRRAFLDPCFHSFCLACAEEWLRVSQCCPLCKAAAAGVVYDVVAPEVFRRIEIGAS
jgi:hypothetical protein